MCAGRPARSPVSCWACRGYQPERKRNSPFFPNERGSVGGFGTLYQGSVAGAHPKHPSRFGLESLFRARVEHCRRCHPKIDQRVPTLNTPPRHCPVFNPGLSTRFQVQISRDVSFSTGVIILDVFYPYFFPKSKRTPFQEFPTATDLAEVQIFMPNGATSGGIWQNLMVLRVVYPNARRICTIPT